ncbi:MAG TPA: hypothetical protein VGE38_07490 [Nocardioides sp.]
MIAPAFGPRAKRPTARLVTTVALLLALVVIYGVTVAAIVTASAT